MMTYLKDYALRNIWCTPDQDMQVILEPKRITPSYGTRNSVQVLWETVELPKRNTSFHIFVIGQLNPILIGLFPAWNKWKALCENMNEYSMISECYNTKGVMLPRHRVWYRVMKDKNLIFAIEQPIRSPIKFNYGSDRLFVRVYTNAFFNSLRSGMGECAITIKSMQAVTVNDIVAIQSELEGYRNDGFTDQLFCYVNGRLVSDINLTTARPSDEIEFVRDSSIKARYDFRVGDLREFNSTLDSQSKYLIHPPKGSLEFEDQIIDYYDDTETYLYYPTDTGLDGVLLHRNNVKTIRNVTHRDYSVSVPVVQAAFQSNELWELSENMMLRLYVRHAGYDRPLVAEDNHIRELYKLDDASLSKAMLGIDSNVVAWQAANLENSAYTAIMRSKSYSVDKELIVDALGYYGITDLLYHTPQKVRNINGMNGVWLAKGLVGEASFYEFDENGLLLGYHLHDHASLYSVRDARAKLVDARAGFGTELLDEVYNEDVVTLDPKKDYRFYACDIYDGIPLNNWEDVTGSAEYFIQNGKVHWTNGPNRYTLVRGNGAHLAYSFEIDPFMGYDPGLPLPYNQSYCYLFSFALKHESYQFGSLITQTMRIPMGELDIFLNGHHLIEDIDYRVVFPYVYILNTSYIRQPIRENKQKITVRFTGFCNSDLSRTPRREVGWVDHGLVSRNKRFNVREGHLIQASVAGSIYHPSDLQYAEDQLPLGHLDELNGKPYELSEILAPIRDLADVDTYETRSKSLEKVEQIEDYLSLKLPQPGTTTPNVIEDKYRISSPFFTHLIHDIMQGYFDDDPMIYSHYSDHDVRLRLAQYEYLLEADPISFAEELDMRFVEIVAHNGPYVIELPIHFYRFIEHANRIYGKGLIKLSHYLAIKSV